MASNAASLGETCACNIQHDQQDTGSAAGGKDLWPEQGIGINHPFNTNFDSVHNF